MVDDLHWCSKCATEQPISAFYMRKNGKLNPWCKACYRAWYTERSGGTVDRACDSCGSTMSVTQRRADEPRVFCSRKCKTDAKNAAWAVENQAKKPLVRTCAGCGADMPQSMRSDARYCSDRCNSDANSAHRYARTRGGQAEEWFTLDEIFERDASVCYLCHLECVRSDASMDHVIPVSAPHHGPHTRANVKLAHRACNSRKKDRLLSELSWYVPMT